VTHLKSFSHRQHSPKEHLYDFPDEVGVPPEQRIYVNRNLRMSSIEAVGFDLDHTLSHYDQLSVGELAFSATKEKLVTKKHYPEEILTLSYDPDFLVRGLVVDLDRGNILKMDCHNYVQRVCHGKRAISSSERKNIYAEVRFSFSKNSYSSIDTLFHIPEVYLFTSLVDYFEKSRREPDFRELFFDVREMIDEAHRDGSIKNKIISDPGRYIQADPMIFDLFERLRSNGKRLFLLTNSESAYTDSLLSYASSLKDTAEPWSNYFDIVVTKANKPTFFSRRKSRTTCAARDADDTIECRNAYELEKHLGCKTGKIIYFGDHTYGDILKAKKVLGWRTGMIVPELESEILTALRIRKTYSHLVVMSAQRQAAEREKVAIDKNNLKSNESTKAATSTSEVRRSEVLEGLIQDLSEEIDNLESICQFSYNSKWGSLFREGKQISRFGHQVKDFACIYMHKVSNMLHYPTSYYFQSYLDFMPHEFYL
jgi:5'-nucleotidase